MKKIKIENAKEIFKANKLKCDNCEKQIKEDFCYFDKNGVCCVKCLNKDSHENKVKFECAVCGCYFWVDDRNKFECLNCKDKEKLL